MKRVTIPADIQRGFLYAITIVLGDAIEDKYEVVAKDFPAGLPNSWTSPGSFTPGTISWISNFGLMARDSAFVEELPSGEEYTIELPSGLGDHYVYFDGSNVRELIGQTSGSIFSASLNLGDPPVGHMD